MTMNVGFIRMESDNVASKHMGTSRLCWIMDLFNGCSLCFTQASAPNSTPSIKLVQRTKAVLRKMEAN